jgi:hypothetical protein
LAANRHIEAIFQDPPLIAAKNVMQEQTRKSTAAGKDIVAGVPGCGVQTWVRWLLIR